MIPAWQLVRIPVGLETQPKLLNIGTDNSRDDPVRRWRLPGFWSMHLFRYTGRLRVGSEWFPVRPTHLAFMPPDTELEFQFDTPGSIHYFAHFNATGTPGQVAAPIMQDLGADYAGVERIIEEIVGLHFTRSWRGQVKFWELALTMAERATSRRQSAAFPAVVEAACRIIELELAEPLRVRDLARRLDVSPAHLSRLFHETLGMTARAYLRQRRMRRAEHLLLHSTRPIKSIAREVGLPDLQQFNKTARMILGQSPRDFRSRQPATVYEHTDENPLSGIPSPVRLG